jgi:hypothetical protein
VSTLFAAIAAPGPGLLVVPLALLPRQSLRRAQSPGSPFDLDLSLHIRTVAVAVAAPGMLDGGARVGVGFVCLAFVGGLHEINVLVRLGDCEL